MEAFTLIETIAACLIIGILSALCTSAYMHARHGAKDATCLNNLRSIGQAMSLYTGDHEGFLPSSAWHDYVSIKQKRAEFKLALAPYGISDGQFWCPLDRNRGTDFVGEAQDFTDSSYEIPLSLLFFAEAREDGSVAYRMSVFKDPSTTLFMYDTPWLIANEEGRTIRQTAHKGRMNALYLDWHAEGTAVTPP